MGTSYKPADIVVIGAVEDPTGGKERSVVIVSSEKFNDHRGDLLIASIWTTPRNRFDVQIKGVLIQLCGLEKECWVRTGHLQLIDDDLVLRKRGRMHDKLFKKVCDRIRELLAA